MVLFSMENTSIVTFVKPQYGFSFNEFENIQKL